MKQSRRFKQDFSHSDRDVLNFESMFNIQKTRGANIGRTGMNNKVTVDAWYFKSSPHLPPLIFCSPSPMIKAKNCLEALWARSRLWVSRRRDFFLYLEIKWKPPERYRYFKSTIFYDMKLLARPVESGAEPQPPTVCRIQSKNESIFKGAV